MSLGADVIEGVRSCSLLDGVLSCSLLDDVVPMSASEPEGVIFSSFSVVILAEDGDVCFSFLFSCTYTTCVH